jgi:hypothetical protein
MPLPGAHSASTLHSTLLTAPCALCLRVLQVCHYQAHYTQEGRARRSDYRIYPIVGEVGCESQRAGAGDGHEAGADGAREVGADGVRGAADEGGAGAGAGANPKDAQLADEPASPRLRATPTV